MRPLVSIDVIQHVQHHRMFYGELPIFGMIRFLACSTVSQILGSSVVTSKIMMCKSVPDSYLRLVPRLHQFLLQLKLWNYGQFSMSITLYWVNPVIWAVDTLLNTFPKKCFEYLAYHSSYTHFIMSIIPRLQL